MSKVKKVVILCSLVGLLAVTFVLNIMLNNNVATTVSSSTISTESFFTSFRNTRESTRTAELALYDSVIDSDTTTDDSKAEAEESKLALIAQIEKEVVIEGLICAKGFDDAVFTQSESYINVIVDSAELTPAEVAQIVSIIIEQTGYSVGNITIIPTNS